MSIDCDCSVDVDEPVRFVEHRIVRARKQHECCECQEPIKVGERHHVESGVGYDGDHYRYRTCVTCMRIREHYCGGGWIWGGLADQLYDCIGFDYRTVPEGDGGVFDGDVPLAPPAGRAALRGEP